ncbi:hypothetical protein EYF80_031860 [Liparis tanakae]|uniref:Uncharacterized protein n=1 Tax=Liparis tanakae TaxID=230148 RepID=A0A4Z2GZB8_9TELE|nr:hypothetical protein EYF80_031860 [Liparis tanakae]
MTYIKVLLGESQICALSPGKNQHLSCWRVTELDTLPAAGLTSDLPVESSDRAIRRSTWSGYESEDRTQEFLSRM